eukprot:Gb_25688 [translate_table: standard]
MDGGKKEEGPENGTENIAAAINCIHREEVETANRALNLQTEMEADRLTPNENGKALTPEKAVRRFYTPPIPLSVIFQNDREAAKHLTPEIHQKLLEDMRRMEELEEIKSMEQQCRRIIESWPIEEQRAGEKILEMCPPINVEEGQELLNDECGVCIDLIEPGMTARQLPCLHLVHSHCILKWLTEGCSCPICA